MFGGWGVGECGWDAFGAQFTGFEWKSLLYQVSIVDIIAVLYCICSLFAPCRRRCAVRILLCPGYYTYCTHNILVCLQSCQCGWKTRGR